MRKENIVVVDDERSILKLLQQNLKLEGYTVYTGMDGQQALDLVEQHSPDLLLLDIKMPYLNGIEVCRRLREWSKVPIIVVSALSDASYTVEALDVGADDYLRKPFHVKELLARVRTQLRRAEERPAQPQQSIYRSGPLTINFSRRQVTLHDGEVRLTPTEYSILEQLVQNAGKVLTHQMLLHRVWGPEYSDENEYLRVYIGRLRRKLDPGPDGPKFITTEQGVGYRFIDAVM
ncbi:MAG: response regulator transcription factor [Chloroflexota bacterium]|nr:response regulator transcription factor [Chloroflexota bacterium]